ncbi:hypothetical protein [Fodinicola acaciae]|uniref:hypothetical protein n=1 Tax=Fodinicola acaciae TaxID=2681555 RepID=UPI0013D50D88|nr:hypothetical protein [Fodinicola acaciae]
MTWRPESERSDWTDLDLLTRDEARQRLAQEITETERLLPNAGPETRELHETRLRALREAAADLDGTTKP